MINFGKIRHTALAAAGALLVSTACIAAAVGPGATAGQASIAYAALTVPVSAQASA